MSFRRGVHEARVALELARMRECERVIFANRATFVGLFTRAGLSRDRAEFQADAAVSLGGRVRIGCKFYRFHVSPCRLCGGTGQVLRSKMSGQVHDDCEKCLGKGFKELGS